MADAAFLAPSVRCSKQLPASRDSVRETGPLKKFAVAEFTLPSRSWRAISDLHRTLGHAPSLPRTDLLGRPHRTGEFVALPAERHTQAEEGSPVGPVDGALALELMLGRQLLDSGLHSRPERGGVLLEDAMIRSLGHTQGAG